MINRIFRTLARFTKILKILALVISLGALVYIVAYFSPAIVSITFLSLILASVILLFLSFFLSTFISLVSALSISFLFFLRATQLLSPLNLGLFVVFLILLGLYLRKN